MTIIDFPSATILHPIAAAHRVAAIAAEHADASEQQCSLAAPVVEALVESGLGRLLAPSAIGGEAANPFVLVDVIGTIAAADASAGWCTAIGVASNHLAGYLPEAGARELFVELDQLGAGVFAPSARGVRSAGGYRVTGRWSFASGCQHAAVQACGMLVADEHGDLELGADGGPQARLAFMPRATLNIDETWDVVGMRGTGSHDTAVMDRQVDREHTMSFGDRSWSSDAIYQQPVFGVLGTALASVPLGVGRAALDAVEAEACADFAVPPRPGPRARFADDPHAQRELGGAEVRLHAARSLLIDLVDQSFQLAAAGLPVPRTVTALLGLTCGEAMAASVHAVDVACRISGTAAVRRGSPLERARRDIDTMRKHVMFSPGVGQSLGRQVAGVPTVAWPFLADPL